MIQPDSMDRMVREMNIMFVELDRKSVHEIHMFVLRKYITKLEKEEHERATENSRKAKSSKRAV